MRQLRFATDLDGLVEHSLGVGGDRLARDSARPLHERKRHGIANSEQVRDEPDHLPQLRKARRKIFSTRDGILDLRERQMQLGSDVLELRVEPPHDDRMRDQGVVVERRGPLDHVHFLVDRKSGRDLGHRLGQRLLENRHQVDAPRLVAREQRHASYHPVLDWHLEVRGFHRHHEMRETMFDVPSVARDHPTSHQPMNPEDRANREREDQHRCMLSVELPREHEVDHDLDACDCSDEKRDHVEHSSRARGARLTAQVEITFDEVLSLHGSPLSFVRQTHLTTGEYIIN